MKRNSTTNLSDTLFDEDASTEDSISESLFQGLTNDELNERITLEYTNAYEFKKPVISEWHENENLLYGVKPKTLSKRSNIMIQLMGGFEDTLLSKIKQPIFLIYKPTEHADVTKARKVTSAWELESSVSHEDWEYKDLLTKKLAMVSGRGISKIFKDVPYAHRLEPVDHYDFLIDPTANGMSVESARYLGQDNIIKSRWELEENDDYDKKAVKELIASYAEDNAESIDNVDSQKQNRMGAIGLETDNFFQAGDASYKLLEWYTTIKGVRCVLLRDSNTNIIIKKKVLAEITGVLKNDDQPFWPFESWAYYPDLFNFWSPAPMTRVRELFQLRNISLNQMFDNNEAKNRPMRAYDPRTYTNPALLAYLPDRLIPIAPGRDPEKGLYTLRTEDIIEPKIFNEILENLAGKITGVTSSGAGSSDTKKVGIYYGDQQEIEKRMTLFEISYNRFHLKLGQKYVKYLSEGIDEKRSIKILGEDGVEYEDLKSDDVVEFDLILTGGLTQATNDALEKKSKNEFLRNEIQNTVFNQRFRLELAMGLNGFSRDDIKRALTPIDLDEKQSIRASQDIQKLLLGEEVKPYLKAEIPYMQHIFDYVYETELSQEQETRLLTYIDSLSSIVLKNMIAKAREAMAVQGLLAVPAEFQQAANVSQDNNNKPMLKDQAGLDAQRAQEIPSQVQQLTS